MVLVKERMGLTGGECVFLQESSKLFLSFFFFGTILVIRKLESDS